jgi:uncharacterized integral membrane protein
MTKIDNQKRKKGERESILPPHARYIICDNDPDKWMRFVLHEDQKCVISKFLICILLLILIFDNYERSESFA